LFVFHELWNMNNFMNSYIIIIIHEYVTLWVNGHVQNVGKNNVLVEMLVDCLTVQSFILSRIF